MDDLVQFLRARLDEDERAARAVPADLGHDWCDPGPWVMAGNGGGGRESEVAKAAECLDMPLAEHVAHHIARHDPARALAEVEAKRRIAFLAERLPALTAPTDMFDNNRDAWAEVLKQLALPYADHPDYRGEWKP